MRLARLQGRNPMPRLKPETRTAVRTEIEAAALRCFVTKGYAATTTREIAVAVGLTAGALYSHYASKEALFAAVVARYQSRLAEEETPLRTALARTRFPFDVPELAAAIRDLIESHREFWLLWYVDVIEFDGAHFRSQLAPKALLGQPELRERLDEIAAEGLLTLEPDLAFSMVYMHLFNYFLVETLFAGSLHYGVSHDAAVRAVATVFLDGMLTDRGRARRAAESHPTPPGDSR